MPKFLPTDITRNSALSVPNEDIPREFIGVTKQEEDASVALEY